MNAQRSPGWFTERLGKVTASRMADVCAKTKTGYGASRDTYMAQLLVERLTGQPMDTYQNAAMLYGIEHEADARAAYEFYTGKTVGPCGFVSHPTIEMSGASPDGLVNRAGLIEIKVPNTSTHLDTLLTSVIPLKYIHQMHWQMACTGRKWCDFVSFDPRLPPHLQLFVQRIKCDKHTVGFLESEAAKFLAELDVKIETLNQLRRAA
ncbi:MAG: lambda exonuclease family protein [Gammaproteobacteria bacterium]